MARRSRKSKRRMNSMFLSLLLTALLLIMSTYAWFTANRQVSIDTITAKVSAAEGLQISLDGSTWKTSITVNTTTLTAAGQVSAAAENNPGKLSWPEDLEPVSTIGEVSAGDLVFRMGKYTSGKDLDTISNVTCADQKFIAFDVYLKNSSSQANGDPLLLDSGSSVAEKANTTALKTGLEYSPRIGFLLYDQTVDFTATSTAIKALTSTDATSSKVAIWEPNASGHISEVTTNNSEVAAAVADANKQGVMDTYGLISTSTSTVPVENIVTTTAAVSGKSALQKTIQTTATTLTSAINLTDTSATPQNLVLGKNKIMKMRIYIWLEGQDPDCIDTASTGDEFYTTINFAKPAVSGS